MSAIQINTKFRGEQAETTIAFGMASMANLPGNVLEELALADIAGMWAAKAGKQWAVNDLFRTEDEEEPRVVILASQIDR